MIDNLMSEIGRDPITAIYYVAGILIIGAVVGFYRSLSWCSHNKHVGRRVR